MIFEMSVIIARPPAAVFDFLRGKHLHVRPLQPLVRRAFARRLRRRLDGIAAALEAPTAPLTRKAS